MHIFQGTIRKVLLCFCKRILLISVNYFFFRSLYAEFETETMWSGIPAFRFVGGVHNFEDAKDYPPNICFCEDPEDESPECLKTGVLDLYNCLGNVLGFRNSMGRVLAF
jgi:hypothetical protein